VNNQNEPKILDHEYDGIREYDNPTPGWWYLIFLISVLYAVVYVTFWHFSPLAYSVEEAWHENQVADYKRVFGAVGDLNPDEPTILRMMGDAKMLDVAQSIFQSNCAVCHAKDGGGINGVNLTDDSFKNVKKLEDLFVTLTKGANLGAMPAWEQKLSRNERVILSAYVATLRGRNAPGRAAEGDKIPAWPAIPPPSPAALPVKDISK